MFISYLKITLRKLYREKLYTLINVAGLSLGIACCLILGLFLHNELTYDHHHKNYKRIYRVASELTANGVGNKMAVTSPALAPLLKKENPEISDYVRFAVITLPDAPGWPFYSGDDTYFWKNIYTVDSNIFDVFTYDVIYGDPKTALVDPNFIAVSETFARTHFGDEYPIGKTVSTDIASVKISLVFADLPENTHLKTDVLISYNWPAMKLNPSNLRNDLWRIQDYTYLVLPEDYPQASFKKMTDALYQKYMKEIGDANNTGMDFWLQPMKDIHYKSDVQYDQPTGNVLYLYGSVAIGLLILLVACINYMNLATARSLKRGREVGIHKVLGANRSQLIFQFMGESVLITLMALCLGMIIVELVLTLTPISELIGNQQLTDYATEPVLLWWLIGLTIFTGVASGAYPAFYLSSVPPISALTAIKKAATAKLKLRQMLVLAQFIISIGVIASTFLMVSQMQYITKKPLGFVKDNRVVIRLYGADVLEKQKVIKSELLKNQNVLGMTICSSIPGGTVGFNMGNIENNDGIMEQQTKHVIVAHNDDYLSVMGMELTEGRDFSQKLLTDVGASAIVNETLIRKMGWDEPLGKRIQIGNGIGRVIGVVKDFHFQSMRSSVEPLVLVRNDFDFSGFNADSRARQSRMMVINISGKDIPQTLDHIRNVMGEIDPKHVLEYEFLDDAIDKLYVSEKQITELTGLFAGICMFISCLGLFGLSAFITEQRTKEIGVRKVLGASSMQIIIMLSGPTLILVLIASVIASTAAYLAIDEWLAGFAYRAGINPLVFVLATALVIIVAFITITLQALKTAQADPVNALRYE